MKKIFILICIMLLCGCTVQGYDLKSSLENSVNELALAPIEDLADNNKTLYRYYIEPQIGRRTSTQTGNVFLFNGSEFVMNLDIASIINSRYYKSFARKSTDDQNTLISMQGKYVDFNDSEYQYTLDIYEFENGYYFIDLDMAYVNFYGYVEYVKIEPIILAMMKIGKTVDVDIEKVIAAYSSKQSTEYIKEKLDLFETVIPDSGRIEELMGINPEEEEYDDLNTNEHEADISEDDYVQGDDEGSIAD